MLRHFIPAALAIALLSSLPVAAQDSAHSLVGVWKLSSFERREVGTGKTVLPFGDRPSGYRIHTRGGHAFYMFFAEGRKPASGVVTDADRLEWFKTMTAAGGRYEVEGNNVTFKPEVGSSPSASAPVLRYRFEIVGKTLTMTTDPVKAPAGAENVFVTTYERVE